MVLTGIILAVRGGDGGLRFGNRIALIEIDGVISDDRELLEQLEKHRDDSSVRGYVVAINSPGGVVGPSQSIYREPRRLREEGRPVVASIGGVAASGGYLVALAAGIDSQLITKYGLRSDSTAQYLPLRNAWLTWCCASRIS